VRKSYNTFICEGTYMSGRYDAVVLLSGGMDSTTALAVARQDWASGEVLGLSFDYGQRHRTKELYAAAMVASHYNIDHKIVDLTSVTSLLGGSSLTDPTIEVPDGHYAAESMRITVVPNRNAIMLSIAFGAARAAGATRVFAGMHAGDHAIYPDCRITFTRAFQGAMNAANQDILEDPLSGASAMPILVTPFIQKSKQDIVQIGTEFGVPFHLTYSCYKGGPKHCGTCGTCTERREAFALAGVTDPTEYEVYNAATI
jgi:7-cyano-7-deazaguanine synthase